MTALLAALVLAAGAAGDAPARAPPHDPAAAATVERHAPGKPAPPRRDEDPDEAMLKELELLQGLDLLENLELFGVDSTSR